MFADSMYVECRLPSVTHDKSLCQVFFGLRRVPWTYGKLPDFGSVAPAARVLFGRCHCNYQSLRKSRVSRDESEGGKETGGEM